MNRKSFRFTVDAMLFTLLLALLILPASTSGWLNINPDSGNLGSAPEVLPAATADFSEPEDIEDIEYFRYEDLLEYETIEPQEVQWEQISEFNPETESDTLLPE